MFMSPSSPHGRTQKIAVGTELDAVDLFIELQAETLVNVTMNKAGVFVDAEAGRLLALSEQRGAESAPRRLTTLDLASLTIWCLGNTTLAAMQARTILDTAGLHATAEVADAEARARFGS